LLYTPLLLTRLLIFSTSFFLLSLVGLHVNYSLGFITP
jgi:hypothetical protein